MRAALLLAVLVLVPRVSWAEPPKLAIVRVEGSAVEGSGAASLGEMLTRLLREEVERIGRYQSIGTPRLGLRELMSAVDCANDSPSCLAAVGRGLQVAKLVLGKLDRAGERYLVTLQLFDVPNQRVDLRLQKGVVGRDALVAEFPRLVRRFLGLRETEAGTLEITASEPGVELRVDGVDQGTAPLKLDRVPVGEYRIEARKPGFFVFKTSVRVEQDQTAKVAVVMAPSQTATPAAAAGPTGIARVRWYTWTLVGVGVAALGAGAGIGAISRSKQKEFDMLAQMRLTRPDDQVGQYQQLLSLRDSGKGLALGANVAFGVGGAALVAGGVLLLRDLGVIGGRERSAAFRATPFASASAGGGMAGLRVEH